MALNRACLALLLFVCLNSVAGKPFLGALLCNWFCDDYEDDGSASNTSADYDYDCGDCGPQRRRTTTLAPTTSTTAAVMPGPNPSEFTLNIPPGGTGYTVVLTNNGTKWGIVMAPQQAAGGQATTTGTTTVVTTTTSGSTSAPATTGAATTGAATTGAATTGAATTEAPAATTTAAATTAAK